MRLNHWKSYGVEDLYIQLMIFLSIVSSLNSDMCVISTQDYDIFTFYSYPKSGIVPQILIDYPKLNADTPSNNRLGKEWYLMILIDQSKVVEKLNEKAVEKLNG